MTEFVVMTSRAPGRNRKVAVVEIEDGAQPKYISERARGVVRIVRHYGSLHDGATEHCAYRRALLDAETLCARLRRGL